MGEIKLSSFSNFKDGDGEDFVGSDLSINIQEVSNGIIVTESSDEGEMVFVFRTPADVISHLEKLWINL